MSDSEQDKSEAPSSYKLQQARKKGSVARGADLGFLSGFAAFTLFLWIAGSGLLTQLTQAMRNSLVVAPQLLANPASVLDVAEAILTSAVRPIVMLAATLMAVVLVFELVQTGFVFSGTPLKPDFNRLNPAQGFKRVFSMRMLVETGKNVLKLFAYGLIAFMLVQAAVRGASALADAQRLGQALTDQGLRLLSLFAVAALAFVVLDQLIVRRDFTKKMRMSRREVKREHRDREGEPRMRQRRKQLHGEFVKLSQSLRNLKGADVVITNPTHFAVALRYDGRTMAAPVVVSRGANGFALRLKRLAFVYGVPTVENRLLAKALFYGSDIGRPVPDATFRSVADVYLKLRRTVHMPQDANHV